MAVRLPPFWAEQPAIWFTQAEALFSLAGITNEHAKFLHVISQLDHRCAEELADVITCPPARDPYTTLRTELIRRLSPSKEQRIRQLLTVEEMGDRKPSQFLRHLKSLAPDMPDDCLRSIWFSRLPHNIQAILAGQSDSSLDSAALCADRIAEVAPQPALATVSPPPDNAALLQRIEDLSHQVTALTMHQGRFHTTPSRDARPSSTNRRCSPKDQHPGNHRPDSISPARDDAAFSFCWYHRRFGNRAQKCTLPCAYRRREN